jgi:transcriptional regulator with XRE-family HTH domain
LIVQETDVKAEELGERLKLAREQAGMTQGQLALAVDYDQRSISQWERGIRKIPAVDIPIFASVLNVPIAFFFEGQLEPSDIDDELLRVFHQLPTAESQQTVIQWVRDLKNLLQHD